MRLELAEALRSKGQLEARFKSSDLQLQTLRSKSKVDDKRIHDLTAERNTLATKLKDRNEELVGKTKLLKVSSFSDPEGRDGTGRGAFTNYATIPHRKCKMRT